jgi:hypothetical protein
MSTHKKILTPNPLEILRESVKESAETTKREILSPFRKEFLEPKPESQRLS